MPKFDRVFVWLGGAMFVASLASCGYTYMFRWAGPDPEGPSIAIVIDAALLTLFAAHHSLLARAPLKRRLERIVPHRLIRAVYVWVASGLLLLVLGFWDPIGGTVYQANGIIRVGLAAVQVAGVLLIARSVATIDPLELAGIRDAADSATSPSKEGLQEGGPYRLVRHPLYLGWILVVFGAAHMTGDRLAFAVMTTIYLVVAIPWEERSLRDMFGAEYERYARRVRWRILPYIY